MLSKDLRKHLEKQTFGNQSKMAAYPSGKGTDCNSVLPGSTPGAASIICERRNRFLDKTNSLN